MKSRNIATTIQQYLKENIQLANKYYFNTGKLSDQDKDLIIKITSGDNYTKIISDFYFYLKENPFITQEGLSKEIKLLYNDVINYNSNVYPLIGYDIFNLSDISQTLHGLKSRRKIIELINKLPSISKRNLKNDIRVERTHSEIKKYLDDLEYFMVHFQYLSNRDKEIQLKILKKMFKTNTTLDDLMEFVDQKANFIGGVEFTKEDIKKLSESQDLEIIYEKDDIMIAEVYSPDGIKEIGCNSLWCFTYGSGYGDAYRDWSSHSHNNIVYVLIDFREKSDSEEFMHVLIKPLTDEDDNLIEYDESNEDEVPIYNMSNENYYNPYSLLEDLFGADYKNIITKYLNFNY